MTDSISSSLLTVLTAGATREGLAGCAAPFRELTGIVLETPTDHGHLIRDRVVSGEATADLVILPSQMIEDLQHRGLADDTDAVEIGTIRVGAAVRAGEPIPDVSTVEALRQALFGAGSIVLTEAPSGVHMDSLIDRWGLRGTLEDRIVRYDRGTEVNEHLVASRTAREIAFGVATEILFFRDRGVAYAGPIPEEVQMTHTYLAARLAGSARGDDARRLLDYLATETARAAFAETGIEREG